MQSRDNSTPEPSVIEPGEVPKGAAEIAQIPLPPSENTDPTALDERMNLLASALSAAANAIVITDAQGTILWVNPAFTRFTGYTARETIGKTPSLLRSGKHDQEFYKNLWNTVLAGKVWHGEIVNRRKDGSLYDEEMTITPVRSSKGEIVNFVAIKQDITLRKQYEEEFTQYTEALESVRAEQEQHAQELAKLVEELRQSEASFRVLFSSIPHPTYVHDRESLRFLEVNEATVKHYGYSREELLGMRITEIRPPEEVPRLLEILNRPAVVSALATPCKHRARDGRIFDVEVSYHTLEFAGAKAVLVIAQDVTEQKRLGMELHHNQKLEAVGSLAAGIAHEINTPIQFVGDNIQFLRDAFGTLQNLLAKYQDLERAAEAGMVPPALVQEVRETYQASDMEYLLAEIPNALNQSLDGTARVATIVRAMKAFSHPDRPDKAVTDMNGALQSTLVVARNELKYVAEVETAFGDLPPVLCHAGDMNQVYLNLLINAAHAIQDVVKGSGRKGKIRVETWSEGDWACIAISDSGCGIPQGIQNRIFEPFFTTKEVGRGTGQGLALARSIVVDKHGGTLTFKSEPGKGTTFTVRLPAGKDQG